MFEKFTEKAINAITEAQKQAKEMHNVYVQPEHLLLSIILLSKGASLKLFRMYKISPEEIKQEIENKLRFEKTEKVYETVPFSSEFKNLLKNTMDLANSTGNRYVLFEHLFLSVLDEKLSYSSGILKKNGFNIENAKEILYKLVQKRKKKLEHPELAESRDGDDTIFSTKNLAEDENASKILERIKVNMASSGKELIGTEQILSDIISTPETIAFDVLQEAGITKEKSEEALSKYSSREVEFDDAEFNLTPAALKLMEQASQYAKELGSSTIKAEHILLAVLKTQKGLAYKLLKDMNVNEEALEQKIMTPIEKQMPQSLIILKLAKEEARRLGRNVVGTEMILLGIISEGTGVGFKVLNNLEITLKDVREVIEKIIGYGNEYSDSEINFTRRAKRILEVAWQRARKYKYSRIMSEHLLYAITTEPSSVAMLALEQLGVDAVEIRQGVMKEIET